MDSASVVYRSSCPQLQGLPQCHVLLRSKLKTFSPLASPRFTQSFNAFRSVELCRSSRQLRPSASSDVSASFSASSEFHEEDAQKPIAPTTVQETSEIEDSYQKPQSKKYAKIHDFCLGIPYGTSLVVGGFIWFLISGSTDAVRFGVVLGGMLLALSVSSLSTWKKGKSSTLHIVGQSALSLIIAVREFRRITEVKALFPSVIILLASVAMLGFYCYVQLAGGNPPSKKARYATT